MNMRRVHKTFFRSLRPPQLLLKILGSLWQTHPGENTRFPLRALERCSKM